MVIEALNNYGHQMIKRGVIPADGWASVNVSFAIGITENGELGNVVDLRVEEPRGKKVVKIPVQMQVPYKNKHTNAPSPFFLCDNLSYFFGLLSDKKPEPGEKVPDPAKIAAQNMSCLNLHRELLGDLAETYPKANTLLKFLENHFGIADVDDPFYAQFVEAGALTNGNLVFLFEEDGSFAQEDPVFMKAWNDYYSQIRDGGEDAIYGVCLATGEYGPIARTHPAFLGVRGGPATGVSLVSFNIPTVEYFGAKQGANAPVATDVAERYGAALKYLLSSNRHHVLSNDTHYVFWAVDETSDIAAQIFSMALFGRQSFIYDSDEDEERYRNLQAVMSGNAAYEDFPEIANALEGEFCVMTLRIHRARFAVTNFDKKPLKAFLENVEAHRNRCKVLNYPKLVEDEGPVYSPDNYSYFLSFETAGGKSSMSDTVKDQVMTSILDNTPYPFCVLQLVLNRIKAQKGVSRQQMAVVKAFMLRNGSSEAKEVATVEQQENTLNKAYLLGQIFAIAEAAQRVAIKPLCGIRETYFSAAMTCPATVFPAIMQKMEYHVTKLTRKGKAGLGFYFKKRAAECLEKIGPNPFPVFLSPEEQAMFVSGYYHEVNMPKKKGEPQPEDTENAEEET